MGLQEKKWKRSLEENYLGQFEEDFKQIIGEDLKIQIDWDSFTTADQMKFIPSTGVQQVVNAMREICQDTNRKNTVVESIQKVVIRNTNTPNKSLQIAEGELEMIAGFGGHHSGLFTDADIRTFMEDNL